MKVTLLKREAWESELGFYSRGMDRVRGPAFNVRLYNVWDHTRTLEDEFGVDLDDLPDVDSDGMIQYDIVEQEFDYFKDWINSEDGFCAELEADRFRLAGRSGGWLVYDISDREDDYLTADEFDGLKRLAEMIPGLVDGVAQIVAVETYITALAQRKLQDLSSRESATQEAVVEAVRSGDYTLARQLVDDLDSIEEQIVKLDRFDYYDQAWEALARKERQ